MRTRAMLGMTVLILTTAGCTYDETVRSETMTAAAGNAQAYNMRLQIIDPTPPSAVNTALALPADSYGTDSGAESADGTIGTMGAAQ